MYFYILYSYCTIAFIHRPARYRQYLAPTFITYDPIILVA